VSRAPLPEVRNSHLAGVLERARAGKVLDKIERRKAKRERKRAVKLARREAQMQATQQMFEAHQAMAEKPRKRRHVTQNHLAADVRKRLYELATMPGGKDRLIALYNAHAPSKADTYAATAAVGTLIRFYKRQAPHPMSKEQCAIWAAIDKKARPPDADPLSVPESAPEPIQRREQFEPVPTSMQQASAIPADPITIALQQIAEQGRQTTQLLTYLLTKQQGEAQQSARPALGFSPPRVQVPEMGRRGQIRWLVESHLLRTNENTQEGFRKAYRRIYFEFQDCTGIRIPKIEDQETKLGWVEEHGHIEELYVVACRVFGGH